MPDPSPAELLAAKAPKCPACGKVMRLATAEPSHRYKNIDQINYVCDCGRRDNRMLARKD